MDWDGRSVRQIVADACAFDDAIQRQYAESDQRLAELKERYQQTEQRKRGSDEPPPFSKMQRDVIGYTISLLRSEYRAHVAEEFRTLDEEIADLADISDTASGAVDRRIKELAAEIKKLRDEIEHNRRQLAINNHEIAELRVGATIDRGVRGGEVLRLPQFITRKDSKNVA